MVMKWGVFGASKMSHDFVASVRSMNSTDHQFVAVADSDLMISKGFSNTHHITKAYGSYEELANDNDVEVVYIGVIASEHLNAAKLMLNNGKHLLVNKPLTLNSKQSEELLSLAKTKRLFVMEGLWSRFLPSYEFVLDQIKKGVIGDVVYVNATFGSENGVMALEGKGQPVGGTILGKGHILTSLIVQVFNGEAPEKIKAVGHLNKNGLILDFSAALQFTNEKMATISANNLVDLQNEASILGTKGIIRLGAIFYNTQNVYINNKLYEFKFPEPLVPFIYPLFSGGICYQVNEVRKCIREGQIESKVMSHKDSLTISEIQDEIRKQISV